MSTSTITTSDLILGPGALYSGAFGAVEPVDTAVASDPDDEVWTDVGGTYDGVEVTIAQEYTELEVDQVVDVVGRRLTKREFMIKTNLAQPTLENLALVMNAGTVASGGTGSTAFKSLEPNYATSATQPNYKALLMDGYAPNGNNRRVIVRKALSTDDVSFAYSKKDQTVFSVTFAAHYVSKTIAPFKYVDSTAV